MSYEFFDSLVRVLGGVVAILIAWLAPKIHAWLTARTDAATTERVMALVAIFAQAAEQLLKADDPTGEKRREYVIEELRKLGIQITEDVLAMIEGAVWEINTETAAVLTDDSAVQEG